MNKKLQILTLLLITMLFVNAQTDSIPKSIIKFEYSAFAGKTFAHHEEMKPLTHNLYMGNDLRVGFQTTGKKDWHHIYKFPYFGFGFYAGSYNNPTLGNPLAGFVFLELPFSRTPKSYFSTSWGVGMTFNLNEYDSVTNPENIAIGSDMNVYIDFVFSYKYRLSDHFQIGAGIKLQHFSNGATRYPNLGLNMASGVVTLSYSPKIIVNKFYTADKSKDYDNIEITPFFGCGFRAKSQDEPDVKYFNSTTSISVNKRINRKRTVGIGFDYFYQGYLINYYQDQAKITDSDLMSYATFLSSGMVVDKFRLVVQLGFYLYRPVDFGQFFYERVALRFYPVKKLFANVSIKAHAAKAEFIEWGVGYSF
jgi:hypothetical protein